MRWQTAPFKKFGSQLSFMVVCRWRFILTALSRNCFGSSAQQPACRPSRAAKRSTKSWAVCHRIAPPRASQPYRLPFSCSDRQEVTPYQRMSAPWSSARWLFAEEVVPRVRLTAETRTGFQPWQGPARNQAPVTLRMLLSRHTRRADSGRSPDGKNRWAGR